MIAPRVLARNPGGGHRRLPAVETLAICAVAAAIGAGTAIAQSPLLFVALSGLILVAVTLIRPEAATLAFMALLYANVPTVAVKIHGAPPLLAASFIALLGIPFAGVMLRGQRLLLGPAMPFLLLLLVAAALATMMSDQPALGLGWIGIYATEGLLLYFLSINVIRSRAALHRVLWTLVVVGALVGGLSTFQELTGAYDESFGGFAQITSRGIEIGTDALGEEERQPRLSGPIGEQNRFAQILLVLLPIAIALTQIERRRTLRLIAIGCAGLILSATVLTYSRGAAVAMVAMLVLSVMLRFVALRRVLTIVTLGALLAAILAPAYLGRLGSLSGIEAILGAGGGADVGSALLGRAALGVAALQVLESSPLVGVGPGVFAAEYSARLVMESGITFLGSAAQYPAHNLYLGIAADMGLLGLTAFLAVVGVTLAGLWRVRRRGSATARSIATALIVSMCGYLVSAVFLHLSFERYFWILIALATAAILVLTREEGLDRPPAPAGQPSRPLPR